MSSTMVVIGSDYVLSNTTKQLPGPMQTYHLRVAYVIVVNGMRNVEFVFLL